MADEDQNQNNDEAQPDPSQEQGGEGAPQSSPDGDANGNTEAADSDNTPDAPRSTSELLAERKYSPAVYTVPEDGFTYGAIADATGLARQNLDELVRLNPDYPYGIRTSFVKGDKVNLPQQFSYVDVKGVKGGDPIDE